MIALVAETLPVVVAKRERESFVVGLCKSIT
jgi:hypothetical protein